VPDILSLHSSPKPGRILVVDDDQWNRDLLRDILVAQEHTVSEAEDGVDALEKAAGGSFDVILLDVVMPRMDGIEACRRLKQDPKTAPIPVLMVTTLTEKQQRLLGIAAGANDYLTKPIVRQDVLLRVKNAVHTKRLYDQIRDDFARLRELEALRESLTHFIVHDMRSPLQTVLGGLKLALKRTELPPDTRQYLTMAYNAADNLSEMVGSLLDIARIEAGHMPLDLTEHDLALLAEEARTTLLPHAAAREIEITLSGTAAPVLVDEGLIRRVLINLIGNAIKFSPKGGTITVRVQPGGDVVRAEVSDAGPGLPKEEHHRIFEKFSQLAARKQNKKYSTGLGLAFCKLAVELHGGTIGVESEVGQGSTFWLNLPNRHVAV
jgi:two-component system, sensor histidine kinase and response regulator